MIKENPWGYFKVGDIIMDADYSVWGDKLFEISCFHGNEYSPLALVYFVGKPKTNANICNLRLREVKLISALKRPFEKINKKILINLMKKGNIEAKREFKIRINTKTL